MSRLTSSTQRVVGSGAVQAPRGGIKDFEGEYYDVIADNLATLTWSNVEGDNVVIRGPSDFALLNNFKNALLSLRADFTGEGGRVFVNADQKEEFNRRLLLLEHEIEGLLKRRINFSLKDQDGGHRTMDYTNILNEKENQIVELEKKIQNYEERFRRIGARETELENRIAELVADVRRKEDLLRNKNDIILAEFANGQQFKDAWARVKRNVDGAKGKYGADLERTIFDGVVLPTVDEIRADNLTRDNAVARQTNIPNVQRLRGSLVTLFKEFERVLNSPDLNQAAIDRTLEGFLLTLDGSRLRETVTQTLERVKLEDRFNKLRSAFVGAAGLFKGQLERLKLQNPSARFEFDSGIFDILQGERIETININGVLQVERFTERTVEVPVQDARTKHLIHLLSIQMKKFMEKYPKLRDEIDTRLYEYFQQEIIDLIEVDEIDRIVQIVKYVPQVVKVENVYAYSSQKSKRVEFHLRVLIKALLEELEKLKRRSGAVLEMDEGILAMINQEIMGVIDVDDVLKVFRVVPKIVEVEKIVEKIVERVVEIPQVIPIEKIVEKIVEVAKIQEVEKIVHVPVEIIRYVDNVIEKIVEVERVVEKIVEVPRVIEKVVERVIEIPKIQEVVTVVERIVEKEVPVTVEKVVNHLVPEVKEIQVIKEKVVPVERIVERIV